MHECRKVRSGGNNSGALHQDSSRSRLSQLLPQLMTRVGVVVPWIAGFCTFAITAIVSSKPVPGRCPVMGTWPSKDFQTASRLKLTSLPHLSCVFDAESFRVWYE